MYLDPEFAATFNIPPPVPQPPRPLPTVIPDIPVIHYEVVHAPGSRTLWVVCVIMALSSLAFYGMAMRVSVQKRLFHVLTSLITTFAFLSYFAMATGGGNIFQEVERTVNGHHVVGDVYSRQIFWARYVDWTITTPLLLIDLGLLAGLNGASILITIVADVIMVLTGMFAALGDAKSQTWGWFTIACLAYLTVIYQLANNGSHAVANKNAKTKSFFQLITAYTLILWTVYPIIWGVAAGGRHMSVDGEIIAYAVLDILAKPVFGFWLLTTYDKLGDATPKIEGFWANGLNYEGTIRVGETDE